MTLVPDNSKDNDGGQLWRQVFRPNHLTYMPFGDLLFSDNFAILSSSTMVYCRKEAVQITPIAAEQSRDAHGWKEPTSEVNHGDEWSD